MYNLLTYPTFPLFNASVISFLSSDIFTFSLESSACAIARSICPIASLNLFKFLGIILAVPTVVGTVVGAPVGLPHSDNTHPLTYLYAVFKWPGRSHIEVILYAMGSIDERTKSKSSKSNPFTSWYSTLAR